MGSNGCGCQKGPFKWFKPPYSRLFYPACVQHDLDYDDGGDWEDRRLADEQLFYNMGKIAMKHARIPLELWWMMTVAIVYYGFVRAFGKWHFNYIEG